MKNAHKFLKADYTIHQVFAGLAVLLAVLIPFTEFVSGIFLLLLWPLLGLWQVISALVLSIRFGDTIRPKYLLAVAGYFVVLFTTGYSDFMEKFVWLWLPFSFVFAGWYAYRTHKDANYSPKSFWDLEF